VGNHPEIATSVGEIGRRFDALSGRRDRALTTGRQIVRLSANAIRAVHRGDRDDAQTLIAQAGALVRSLTEDLAGTPEIWWAGYVQDALKEFTEANIANAVVAGNPIPSAADLGVEDAAYLNGMAEAASELRRDVLDLLRNAQHDRATALLATMDEIYDALVIVDALPGDGAPGDLSVVAVGPGDLGDGELDAHGMAPVAVLASLGQLGGALPPTYVVGCQPADVGEGIGLTPAVAAAVDKAVDLVTDLVTDGLEDAPLAGRDRATAAPSSAERGEEDRP